MTNPQNHLTPQPAIAQQPPQAAHAPAPEPAPQPQLAVATPTAVATQTLDSPPSLLNPGLLNPSPASQALAPNPLAETTRLAPQFTALLCPQDRPAAKPRNGKIAHLPKLERDMVSRMLSNNIPHSKIVNAMDDCGFRVTRRNISNWKTRGGYKEWCAAQAHALELRTFQDNLTELLRRHDASELPEVGLQSAATTLSAILVRPDLMRELVADPAKYSKLIELQCRLAREIQALQKSRDDAAKALGRQYNPELLKRQNEEEIENIREVMSSKIGKSAEEADIPHRNFIPKQLEPVPPPTPEPLPMQEILKMQLDCLRRRSAPAAPVTPNPEPAH